MVHCSPNSSIDSGRNLSRALVAIEAGKPLPDEVSRWLSDGIERYLAREGRLDECLGLVGRRGKHRRVTVSLRDQRDEGIRLMADSLESGTQTEKAKRLAAVFQRIEDGILVRSKMGELERRALGIERQAKLALPRSWRQVQRILAGRRDQ